MRRSFGCVLVVLLVAGGGLGAQGDQLPVDPAITWSFEPFAYFSSYGRSVAAAGDFNGDGYGDLIAGAPAYESEYRGGRIYMHYGSGTGPGEEEDWYVTEAQVEAKYGEAVSWAGDVNGDGYDDVAVGAPTWKGSHIEEGKVEVYFGHGATSPGEPWVARGRSFHAFFGQSVCGLGDVNGDGYDDLLVGAPGLVVGGAARGGIYLFGGSPSFAATETWSYAALRPGGEVGACIAGMGDVNGDGYNDAVVGAPGYGEDDTVLGAAYVFLGQSTGLGAAPASIVVGEAPDGGFGEAVAMTDLNGDGFSDVVVGAPHQGEPGSSPIGRAFVYLSRGVSGGLDDAVVLSSGSDKFGYSVAAAGDLGRDGFDDLIVGTRQWFTNEPKKVAFVFVGRGSGARNPPDQTMYTPRTQYVTRFTANVAGAGDLNGDDEPDVVIGNHDTPIDNKGAVVGYLGNRGRGRLGKAPARTWSIEQADAGYGGCAANVGDVDGDGWDDLLVTAHLFDTDREDAGAAFLYAGGPGGWSDEPVWTVTGMGPGVWLGHSAAALGDVNGDGYADVGVGAPHASGETVDDGAVMCYFGSPAGLPAEPDFVGRGGQRASGLGYAMEGGGDVNGDGYSDFIVGAPLYDGGERDAGRVIVYYGNPHSLSDSLRWTADGDEGGGWLGFAVAIAGDTDRDGCTDIVVGAPHYSDGEDDEGAVLVFEGSRDGLPSEPTRVIELDRKGARLGTAIATAGDVNGDMFSDIIVAAGGSSVIMSGLGTAFIFFGGPAGLEGQAGWSASGETVGGSFGHSVRGLGDVNGDGFGDVAVGDPLYDGDHLDCGRVCVFMGGVGGPVGKPSLVVEGDANATQAGRCLGAVGDANGDGWTDLMVARANGTVSLYETQSGRRLLVNARQVPPDRTGSIALRGYSGATNQLHLCVTFRPPTAATRVRVEYQVQARERAWEDAPVQSTDTRVLTPNEKRAGSLVEMNVAAQVAATDRYLKWRVRLVANDPRRRTSRWFYHSNNITGDASVVNGVAPEVPPPPEPPPSSEGAPQVFGVEAPFPNPFNPDVTIPFTVDRASNVRVSVHDVRGTLVARLLDRTLAPGPHQSRWSGETLGGVDAASGIYFVRVECLGRVATRKLVLVR